MPQQLQAGQCATADSSAGFWQIEAGTPVVTVDSADSLRDAAALLRAACAVGIDCEWQPGSSRPSATLLQLAVRTDVTSCTVLILVRRRDNATAVHQLLAWRGTARRLTCNLWQRDLSLPMPTHAGHASAAA